MKKSIKEMISNLSISNKKVLIFSSALIFIVIILVFFYIQTINTNYRKIKIDKHKHIVYKKLEIQDEIYPKYIPYINIDSPDANNANIDIDSLTNKYIDNNKTIISYEYNISGDYLSLVLKAEDYSVNVGPKVEFKTYIFNLNNKKIVSDAELLEMFNISNSDVSRIIEYDFRNFYEDLVSEDYYRNINCNYSCFIKHRGVGNYIENVSYYIKNGDLVAYKPFIIYSSLNDGEYFNPDNYEFMITESVKE